MNRFQLFLLARPCVVLAIVLLWRARTGITAPAGKSHPVATVTSSWNIPRGDPGNTLATTERVSLPLTLRWAFQPENVFGMSEPAVSDGRVYLTYARLRSVTESDARLVGLNLHTGVQEWTVDLGKQVRAETRPVVSAGSVVLGILRFMEPREDSVPSVHEIVAFRPPSSKPVWSKRTEERYSESLGPFVLRQSAQSPVVAIYNGKTGKKIGEREDWRQRPCASTDGWLFAPAGDEDEQEGYRLEAFHLFKPEPIWIKRNVYAPVAASQGRVFAALMVPVKFPRNAAIPRHVSKFRKGLCCLDLEGQVIWKRTDITLSERYEPPMALAGGRIFVNAQKPKDETGRYRTAIESLDTATGKTLGQAGVGGHPRVAGDVLYLLGDDRFFALSVKDGKTLWHARKLGKYDLGEGVKRGPVIAQGMVFVSNDKRLLSLEPMRLGRDVRKR